MPAVHALAKRSFLFLCLVVPLAAQQPPDVPPANDAVIKSETREVDLDLVIRDAKGKVVKNVKPDEIAIYENGVKQEIRSFRYLPGREVARGGTPSSNAESAPAQPTALPTPNVVCMVFHHLDPRTKQLALQAASDFLRSDLPANTWISALRSTAT